MNIRNITEPLLFKYTKTDIISMTFNGFEMEKSYSVLMRHIINITESIREHPLENPRTVGGKRQLYTFKCRN